MRPPRAKLRNGRYHPISLANWGGRIARGENFEDALISGDRGRGRGSDEGGEAGLGAVRALDGVYVGRVDGGRKSPQQDSFRRERGRDGVCVKSTLALLANRLIESKRQTSNWVMNTHFNTSDGSPF